MTAPTKALADLVAAIEAHAPALVCWPEVKAARLALAPSPTLKSGTEAALADVARGEPAAAAARKHGIAPSTLFRALKRQRTATPCAVE